MNGSHIPHLLDIMMLICVTCLCDTDVEVGPHTSHCRVVDQHLSAEHRCRQKQRPIAVHDTAVLAVRLRPSHAGMYSAACCDTKYVLWPNTTGLQSWAWLHIIQRFHSTYCVEVNTF